MEQVPDWAIERALILSNRRDGPHGPGYALRCVKAQPLQNPTVIAFARYIAEYEEAPVDPVRLEARKLMDAFWPQEDALTGSFDNGAWQERIEKALRRGIEIGGSK